MDAQGQTTLQTNQAYVELASGLNHLVNGQWVESREEIAILRNGTAVATNGQHQAIFPEDIYQGQIELVTPDGQHLRSRPMGLSYFDGTNNVLIAELKHSIGLVAGHNQVIYPNAFTDFKADVRYTYTKAGFEQDIILREQPPTPESFGLNPATARLEVLTEFFSPPQPAIQSTAVPPQAGVSLTDQNLKFGAMQMMPGRAFMMGEQATDARVRVGKQWLRLNGRQFLMEEVPVKAIADRLAELPLPAVQSSSCTTTHIVSKQLVLPPQRLAKTTTQPMLLARASVPTQGLVLDYQTVNGTFNNFTFQGDTTYYLGGVVVMGGTNTFEGGTVIKFDDWYPGNELELIPWGGYNLWTFKTGPYRPAIFTSMEDDSVGERIDGSDGSPYNTQATYLHLHTDNYVRNPIQYARFSWAGTAIHQDGGTQCSPVVDCQFVNCGVAILDEEYGMFSPPVQKLYNVLMANCGLGVQNTMSVIIDGENMTVDQMDTLLSAGAYMSGNFTNCILSSVTNLTNSTVYATFSGVNNGFYNSPVFGTSQVINNFYPFQAVGAGNYYLTNGCNFFNQGTTNIDPAPLTDLRQKTTYPPLPLTNTVSANTTLNPQALRDTDTPDLGYHYDPIDYLVDTFTVTNALLTISSGTVIAADNAGAGIWLSDGSAITSIGTALSPNWFVHYLCVQEQSVAIGSSSYLFMIINPWHSGNLGPNGVFQFSKFSLLAGGSGLSYHFYDTSVWAYQNLLIQSCELWNGPNIFDGTTSIKAGIQNTLFARSSISATALPSVTNYGLSFSNSLFWNMPVIIRAGANSNLWSLFNNDFDGCALTTKKLGVQHLTVNGYNAYLNCGTNRLMPTNVFDIVTNVSLAYQTGPLGTFYQPTNNLLINKGSTNANLVGLYHYTTQTNQMKETNSIVDIGYHYVALNPQLSTISPVDTDGDGIPDYVEDANGNGLVDNGENSWTNYNSANGLISGKGVVVFTPLK